MQTCDEFMEQISAIVDLELSDDETSTALTHMGTCEPCRAFFNHTLKMRHAIAEEADVEVPVSLVDRIQAVRQRKGIIVKFPITTIREFLKRRIVIPAPALVLATIVLIAGGFLFSSLRQSKEAVAIAPPGEIVYVMTLPEIEVRAVSN